MGKNEDEMRCTDKKLFQLCDRFNQHVKRFEQHELNEQKSFDRLISAQQVNTEAITTLTGAVSTLVEDTTEIVKLHKDFQGAARVGKGVQGLMIWCLKWGVIGTAFVAGVDWLIVRFY